MRRIARTRRPSARARRSCRDTSPGLVGDVPHDLQVVRDEKVGDAHFLLQVHQQVEHLRLDRDVERRHRLVGDDQPRDAASARGPRRSAGAARPRTCADNAGSARAAARPAPSSPAPPRAAPAGRARVLIASGSSSSVPICLRGLSDAYGFWNTICTSGRSRLRVAASACATSTPSSSSCARRRRLDHRHLPRQRRLAAARFADHGQRAPGLQRERHAVERAHHAPSAGTAPARPRNGGSGARASSSGAVALIERRRGIRPRLVGPAVRRPPAHRAESGSAPGVPPASASSAARSLPAARRRIARSAATAGIPAGRSCWPGHDAGNRLQPRTVAGCARAARRAAPAVYGWRGVSKIAGHAAPSRLACPAYITTTRCAVSATTARSCVISSSAMPRSRCRRSSSSRTCACTVTSSAVVGSSAISSRGLHGDAPSRSSPAAPCRPRAGADRRRAAPRRSGISTCCEQLQAPARAAPAR